MFSVVIPAYNHEKFIARAIEGVLAQDFSDFELIIVDDGSKDATVDRIAEYDDPRIRLVQQSNAGEAGARNSGIAQASHAWIAFLDGDDYWFPSHLSEAARVIAEYPATGFVSTGFISGSAWSATVPAKQSDIVDCGSFFELAGKDLSVVYPSTAVIRRDIVIAVGGFSKLSRRGTDQEYWVRVGLVTPLAHSRRITVYYYQHQDSIMANSRDEEKTVPEGREAMWPSLAVIRSVHNDPKFAHLKPDFERYERQATYLSMIGYISQRRYGVARHLSAKLPGRRLDRSTAILWLLLLPDALLSFLLNARAVLRRGVRLKG